MQKVTEGILSKFPNHIFKTNGEIYSLKYKRTLKLFSDRHGYLVFAVRRKDKKSSDKYRVHTLIAECFLGPRPKNADIDHINQNRKDNAIENLRYVSRSINNHNTGLRKTNTSGTKGVSFRKKDKFWEAEIGYEGTRYKLGIFKNKNDAILARRAKEKELGLCGT